MSVLSGSVNLRDVNLKPSKANKLLSYLTLPFNLKAGMIGKLALKFSLLSLWSNPLELEVEELMVILGPNMGVVSHDESYIDDEDLDESYDENNMFNIFEH